MAMTTCTECGSDISTTAEACPKCGAPTPKSPTKRLLAGMLLGGMLIGGVVVAAVTWFWPSLLFTLARPIETLIRGDAPQRQNATVTPQWKYHERTSPMDNSISAMVERDAEEVMLASGSVVRPSLTFGCTKGTLVALVTVHGQVEPYLGGDRTARGDDSSEVRIRFDDRLVSERWLSNRDFLQPRDAEVFLRSVLQAESVHFEWRKFGGGARVAKFKKGNLREYVDQLAKHCGNLDLSKTEFVGEHLTPSLPSGSANSKPK